MSANFTQQEYEEMLARSRANAMPSPTTPTISVRHIDPRTPKRQWNKTEEAFGYLLDARLRVGDIHNWWFEGLTFKLGRDCRYTPDFAVIHSDGSLHLYEVKGAHVRDDARAKYRAAATMFPCFGWWWAQFKKGQWSIEQEPQTLRPGGHLRPDSHHGRDSPDRRSANPHAAGRCGPPQAGVWSATHAEYRRGRRERR